MALIAVLTMSQSQPEMLSHPYSDRRGPIEGVRVIDFLILRFFNTFSQAKTEKCVPGEWKRLFHPNG
jgi:hypothetical protein